MGIVMLGFKEEKWACNLITVISEVLKRDRRAREKSPSALGKKLQQGGGKQWDVTWCSLDVVFVSCGHLALVRMHDFCVKLQND